MPEPLAGPGDRTIRAGLVVTAVGMALTLVAMLPLVSEVELPSAFWWLSMLTGVGLAMVLIGLGRNGRRRSRTQTTARAALD
jgi:membrane protein implicated in regulation of membrane protease activity